MIPLLQIVTCIGQDPNSQDGILIQLSNSGQILGIPAKVLHDGAADALRVNAMPLPVRGTKGLVAFVNNDVRNAIWLGSVYTNFVSAVTAPADDPNQEYHAHNSGDWRLLDGAGNYAHQFADGSYLSVSAAGSLPTTFRRTVNAAQALIRQVFPFSERAPNPPAMPFVFNFVSASGTSVNIDAAGNLNVDLAASKTLNISQGGAPLSDFLALVSKLVMAFNIHEHTNVQTGGGVSGPPSSLWSASTVDSTAIKISN